MNLNRYQQHYLANDTPHFMQHDKERYWTLNKYTAGNRLYKPIP